MHHYAGVIWSRSKEDGWEGWRSACTCGWVSRPRETRDGGLRSWNRHATNAFEQAQH